MKTLTVKELEAFDFYLIGDKDREDYFPAIIGLAKDESHIAYSFDKLVECFSKANDWSYEEAIEWIEYNVERALLYYGAKAPVILEVSKLTSKNKKYIPIKVLTN